MKLRTFWPTDDGGAYHTSSKSWIDRQKSGRGVSAYRSSQLCTASSITKVDVAWNPWPGECLEKLRRSLIVSGPPTASSSRLSSGPQGPCSRVKIPCSLKYFPC